MKQDIEEKMKAYKAIANETRLTILLEVSRKKGGLPFGELRDKLKLNSNALDYHLGKLTDARLIENIPRTPTTKRAQPNQTTEVATLRATEEQRKPPSENTHYSYYQITEYGREILPKIGVKVDKSAEDH